MYGKVVIYITVGKLHAEIEGIEPGPSDKCEGREAPQQN